MTPSLDVFLPLVGTDFTVETLAGQIQLTLTNVTEYPRKGLPAEFRAPLSLIFSGTSDVILSQDNYYVEHMAMGRQIWCIVPISSPAHARPAAASEVSSAGQRYQVLFT